MNARAGAIILHGGADPPDQRLGDVLVMNLQTKADFTALMHKFLDPLKPCYSAGCARLHLGETGVTYNQNAIELEAFSRPLWALVPFWVGGGSDPEFEKSTARVLPPAPTRKTPNTGAPPGNTTSVMWRWRLLPAASSPHRKSCGPRFLIPKTEPCRMAGADQRPHHPGLQLAVFPHPCKPCPEKRGDAFQPGTAGGRSLQN